MPTVLKTSDSQARGVKYHPTFWDGVVNGQVNDDPGRTEEGAQDALKDFPEHYYLFLLEGLDDALDILLALDIVAPPKTRVTPAAITVRLSCGVMTM